MAIQYYPSASETVSIYLTSDPIIADANDEETLDVYRDSGDARRLVIPADATVVVISPLAASAQAYAPRQAGPLSTEAGEAYRRSRLADASEPIPYAAAAEILGWGERHELWLCALAVRSISDWSDVRPATEGGFRTYPLDTLEQLPMGARKEIAEHVARISRLSDAGKASSAIRCGGPTTASSAPGPAAPAPPSGGDCEATAAAPSPPSS